MRTWTSIVLAAAVIAFVGCTKSDTGGPGKTNPTTNPLQTKTGTFEIKEHSVTVTQGAKEPLDISITRKGGFDQAVKLTFDPPKDIMVKDEKGTTIKDAEIKDKDSKTKVYIEAGPT